MKILILLLILFEISPGKPLPIPQILEKEEGVYKLEAVEGSYEFFEGIEEETYGYNGDILGPTIRLREGETAEIQIKNSLKEETAVHWHGLRVVGAMVGGPHNVISPGFTWKATFPVEQGAATLWYHPHLMNKTGSQVYKGLAGLMIIDSDQSDRLPIPRDYGKDDIPIIIQDKRFNSKARLEYMNRHGDATKGMLGDIGIVNGVIDPTFSPELGYTRFRILNGANARILNLGFSDYRTFYQIATDGGFLEKPLERREVILAPGERIEILVKFDSSDEEVEFQDNGYTLLTFIPKDEKGKVQKLPDTLVKVKETMDTAGLKRRNFVIQGMGNNVNINDKKMDMDRIDESVKLNEPEIWVVTNATHNNEMMGSVMGMMGDIPHPFHIHNTQFRIISRDGWPTYGWERGDKDTVLISPGETVELLVEFRHQGLYMYHGHNLEHEDRGMMGQFNVSK